METQVDVESLASGRFQSSAAVWVDLFDQMNHAGPFLSPRWTGVWVQVFGSSLRPSLVTFRNRQLGVIGACLLTARTRYHALLPHVRWHLNTDGEPASDSVVIEHNGVLASLGQESRVYAALAQHVECSRVDELRLSGVDESGLTELLAAFPSWSKGVEWREAPYVQLDRVRARGGDHLGILSRNTRAQLRRSIRRYGTRGAIRLQAASTAEEAEAMLRELIHLHQARWAVRGGGGGFASQKRREMHTAFVREATPVGEAQLLRMTVNGETVGVLYNLVAHGKVCFYQSGFRYEADQALRPGMVAHHLAVEYNVSLGNSEYDFMASAPGEGRYKYSLATDVRRLAWVTLHRPGWRTRYFSAVRSVRRLLTRGMSHLLPATDTSVANQPPLPAT
ncbi:MAG: GNAT family N-acetyltransferase [Gemmatimonadota bacterium]|nr:GNAT family N-acetyltransferase [Gemmatimonadota bacterium]